MEIVRKLAAVEPRHRGAVAAIGNFDGVHLGHRAVIGEAARIGASALMITHDPVLLPRFDRVVEVMKLRQKGGAA